MAFVKDFDLENETIHLVFPFEEEILNSMNVMIKSRDIDFCNHYYTDH